MDKHRQLGLSIRPLRKETLEARNHLGHQASFRHEQLPCLLYIFIHCTHNQDQSFAIGKHIFLFTRHSLSSIFVRPFFLRAARARDGKSLKRTNCSLYTLLPRNATLGQEPSASIRIAHDQYARVETVVHLCWFARELDDAAGMAWPHG